MKPLFEDEMTEEHMAHGESEYQRTTWAEVHDEKLAQMRALVASLEALGCFSVPAARPLREAPALTDKVKAIGIQVEHVRRFFDGHEPRADELLERAQLEKMEVLLGEIQRLQNERDQWKWRALEYAAQLARDAFAADGDGEVA